MAQRGSLVNPTPSGSANVRFGLLFANWLVSRCIASSFVLFDGVPMGDEESSGSFFYDRGECGMWIERSFLGSFESYVVRNRFRGVGYWAVK